MSEQDFMAVSAKQGLYDGLECLRRIVAYIPDEHKDEFREAMRVISDLSEESYRWFSVEEAGE